MKDLPKKQKILIGVLLVSIFAISMSVTYAYFDLGLSGEANDEIVTTGTLSLNYVDGPELTLNRAYPSDYVEKTITVTNTGSLDTHYKIGWKSLNNEITNDELVVSYTCTSYINYGTGSQAIE